MAKKLLDIVTMNRKRTAPQDRNSFSKMIYFVKREGVGWGKLRSEMDKS